MATVSAVSDRIRSAFLELEISVDELLVDPKKSAEFAERLILALPNEGLDVTAVLRELIRLRKVGEAKGGLPRRSRAFGGRNKPR